MISEALIGCRVKDKSPDCDVEGIIVGSSMSEHGKLYVSLMKKDRTFTDLSLNAAIINEEDYKKLFKKLKESKSIDNRFEIIDL